MKYCFATQNDLFEVNYSTIYAVIQSIQADKRTSDVSHCIISSTGDLDITKSIREELQRMFSVHLLSQQSRVPFNINYSTPETLGLDRISNSAGAVHFFPGQTSLIIDAGTCITYDVIVNGERYVGGAITPGFKMRFKAMNDYSARLPLLEDHSNVGFPGESTDSSLMTGVFYGILGEIHQFIEETEQSFGPHKVLITGGDSFRFEEGIKYPTFANPKLTLWGLNEILSANI